jgi:integrase
VADEQLKGEISRVHEADLDVYGVRKVWQAPNREGVAIAPCRVERLMRELYLTRAVRSKVSAGRRPPSAGAGPAPARPLDAAAARPAGRDAPPDGARDVPNARAAQAGLADVHPHRFRHTFAHRWLSGGGQERDLMMLAGWRSDDMLSRYAASTAVERVHDAPRPPA